MQSWKLNLMSDLIDSTDLSSTPIDQLDSKNKKRKQIKQTQPTESKESKSQKSKKQKKPRTENDTSEEYDNFKVGFGKKNDVVETPDELYKILNDEFHFDFDPAPVWPNGVIERDGLECDWGQSNFINPPYSNIGKWFEKAYKESIKGKTSVFLVPFRLTPIYWRKWVYPYASEIRVIANRIQFKNYPSTAPFPVGIIVYRPSDGSVLRPAVDFEHEKYAMKRLL